jgi:hypothetical protein
MSCGKDIFLCYFDLIIQDHGAMLTTRFNTGHCWHETHKNGLPVRGINWIQMRQKVIETSFILSKADVRGTPSSNETYEDTM